MSGRLCRACAIEGCLRLGEVTFGGLQFASRNQAAFDEPTHALLIDPCVLELSLGCRRVG
ncbi:hypothetical protein D3C83_303790 [compost metagenome]